MPWQIVMNNKADIGLINAHAECYGCHNHVGFFHQELVLVGGPRDGIHAGMIGQGFDSVYLKCFGQLFHLLS